MLLTPTKYYQQELAIWYTLKGEDSLKELLS